jgi:hypothetical protein
VYCADGGAGEDLLLSGNLNVVMHTTIGPNGGITSTYHFNPQGVVGVGLTTGDIYRGTGVSQGVYTGQVGETVTEIENFRLIGPGPGNNLLVHETFHFTVNANGELTSFVDNYSVECK